MSASGRDAPTLLEPTEGAGAPVSVGVEGAAA
jgi:hypothetical protein